MLNEKRTTNTDENQINSLLRQAQLSAHSGDGTSKFSQMARDRAALLRRIQKEMKKRKGKKGLNTESTEQTDEAYGPGYGKKALKGFRKFLGKPKDMEA